MNDEWLRGSIGNSEGMFPVSFVRVEVPLERKSTDDPAVVAATAPASSTYRAVALYAFDAETSHDLSLQVGTHWTSWFLLSDFSLYTYVHIDLL